MSASGGSAGGSGCSGGVSRRLDYRPVVASGLRTFLQLLFFDTAHVLMPARARIGQSLMVLPLKVDPSAYELDYGDLHGSTGALRRCVS